MDDPGGFPDRFRGYKNPAGHLSKLLKIFFINSLILYVVWKPALVTDICHLLQPDDSCAPPLQPLQRGCAAAHLISRKLEIGENVICVEAAAVLILDAYSSYLQ